LVITFFLCYLPYIRIKCGKYALKYGMSSCETDMKRRNCYTHQDIYRENYKFGSTNSWIPNWTEKCSDPLNVNFGTH
jgi:hypothetical protein